MSDRSIADVVADLRESGVRPAWRNWPVCQEAADLIERLDAEVARLMIIATDTQLEDEITRALGYVPSRFFNNSDPWEYAILKMREELDECRAVKPQPESQTP